MLEAVTKIPLAVKVGKIQEHETHWTRALVTQARAKSGRPCPPAQGGLDRGFWDALNLVVARQQGLCVVVPAKANMAVTADARAQAAAGEGITLWPPGGHGSSMGRRAPGRTDWSTSSWGMTG